MARIIDVKTPLDQDVLLFHTMHAKEEMGRLFEYELELYSTDGQIDLDKVLGKSFTVLLELADGSTRYFNGLCSRIAQGGCEGRYNVYHATVRPWLWFLTRTQTCRIFHEKTVPEIIKEIFDRHALGEVKDELTETYTPWTYCVQYNESDFDFVSRLMETEGIYYYFKHDDGKHALVLCDSYSAHEAAYEDDIPYIPPSGQIRPGREHVRQWAVGRQLEPGKYALAAYDFEKPSVDLQVRSNIKREHALADYEVFEYGGEYVERGDGETYARIRIEEQQAKHERIRGESNARALAPGCLFNLGSHPRSDQNGEYLLVSAEYELHAPEYESRDDARPPYACAFTALSTKHPFRTERLTPKPRIHGVQVAIVTGGADIDPDKYGRVKVRFYWDRDAGESCWVRVSQNWGGKGWGGMFVPHVGQEVLVQYEQGDPDLPIIVGRVYNAEQMPPVELPAGKTQSIIRDHGSNEILMEGDAGKQRITMYSPHASTKFSMGAPNSPTAGFFFNTALNWTAFVDAHKETNVGGNQLAMIKGDNVTFVNGNNKSWVDGLNESIVKGNNVSSVDGTNISQVYSSSSSRILGSETTVTVGAKNEVLCAVNQRLTAGTLSEINQSVILVKVPEDSLLAGMGNRKIGNLKEKVGTWLVNASSVARKISSLSEKMDKVGAKVSGTYDLAVGGNCSIKGGPVAIQSKGAMNLKAPSVDVDGKLLVSGNVIIDGNSFTLGSSFVAKK